MSVSLIPHGLEHSRAPCPSPTPGVYSNSRPLSWWCHPTISSSVVPFSSHLQSFQILQAKVQQYVNHELPDIQAGFRKGRGTRNQIANICWIIKKSKRVPEKHLLLLYWLHQNFDCVDHNKLWKILKEMEIPDRLTCLLRHLYADQEATVRTGHGTTDWFQIGKGVPQGCILSPAYLTSSWEMLSWMKHKLESRLSGEISITSDMQMAPPVWHKEKKK